MALSLESQHCSGFNPDVQEPAVAQRAQNGGKCSLGDTTQAESYVLLEKGTINGTTKSLQSNLDDLPNFFTRLKDIESMCQTSTVSKEIAEIVMKSSKETREKDLTSISKNWQSFECCIDLIITIQRPKETDNTSKNPNIHRRKQFKAKFDFIHFLILTKKYRFLLQFLNLCKGTITPKNVRIDEDSKKVSQIPRREDSWIFGANYVHLAAKYCPEALEILLQEQDSRFKELPRQHNSRRNVYPLHLAVMNENNLAAKLLLDMDPSQLTELKDEQNYSPLFYAAAEGSIANLSLMLDLDGNDGKLIDTCEEGGKHVLFKARTYETVMLLSKYRADNGKSRGNDTALKYLTKKANQEAPLALLDQQLDEEGEEIYTLNLDIVKDNLDPFDLHNCFIENERDDLILHPLMETYLEVKWRQVRTLLFIEFLFRLLFVLGLTYVTKRYMALTTCEYEDDHGNFALGYVPKKGAKFFPKFNNFFTVLLGNYGNELLSDEETKEKVGFYINKTHSLWSGLNKTVAVTCVNDYLNWNETGTLEPLCQLLREDEDNVWSCWYGHQWTIVLAILIVVGLFREILDLCAAGWNEYFSSKENILQLAIGILSILFLLLTPYFVGAGSHLAAWAVFLSWIDLTCLLGRFDYFGEYIFMATSIARRMIKFLFVYFPCFVAFAFAFNILLHSTRLFRGQASAILKTFSMMLGELEFASYFAHFQVEFTGGSNISVQLLYILFCFAFAIIVANLLVALTINATDELLREGGATQSKKKVSDILTPLKLKEYKWLTKVVNVLCWPFHKIWIWIWGPPREMFDDPKITLIGVKHQKKPKSSLRYWWNELTKGGNYVMYKIKDEKAIRTNANLQEKFINSIRERLAFKRSKRNQLEADLNTIKRESRVAFEDLKDYIKNLKGSLNEATDEMDFGPKSPELKSLISQNEEVDSRMKSAIDRKRFWKKLRRLLREDSRQNIYDSETDNE